MQVSVEKVSNVERRLTIVVPANQVEQAYTKHIDELVKKANIKGFRPGKAPKSYIEQQFGSNARQEALGEVIQKALLEAITEQKLRPVNTPQIEPKMTSPDQPFEFVASFEVLPEIGPIQFSIDNIEKPVVEVTESDVSNVIEQIRKQYTKWNAVDRPAKEKDRVVITYYAILDGKSDIENKIQQFPLELGSKTMLPGFEDGLIGAKAGEERTLNLIFPPDFGIEERRGKSVDFVVTIENVYDAEIPELDENFFQRLGIKSGKEEDLKKQIKQALEQERDRLVNAKLKEQIFSKLLEQNPLEVPKSLVDRESKSIHDEIYQHQPHDHHQHSENEMSTFNDIAKKRVALGLLIAESAKQANLKAQPDRVHKRILEIASAYENPNQVVEWLSSDERKPGIEAQVMEDQVLENLMKGLPVIEKSMSYGELKASQQQNNAAQGS